MWPFKAKLPPVCGFEGCQEEVPDSRLYCTPCYTERHRRLDLAIAYVAHCQAPPLGSDVLPPPVLDPKDLRHAQWVYRESGGAVLDSIIGLP